MSEPIPFRRVPIAPFDCLSESWGKVRDQYWLFVGICVVGILLGSVLPMGILLGPLMCGIYSCYIDKWQGRPARFEGLFKGFEAGILGQSIIATLVMAGLTAVVGLPLIVVAVAAGFLAGFTSASRGGQEAAGAVAVAVFAGAFLLWMLLALIVGVFFAFAYPLIVDKRMSGLTALKLSARAAWANVWGLLGLALTTMVLGVGGMLCCYVGAFMMMPITFGAFMAAYVKVFGLSSETPQSPS